MKVRLFKPQDWEQIKDWLPSLEASFYWTDEAVRNQLQQGFNYVLESEGPSFEVIGVAAFEQRAQGIVELIFIKTKKVHQGLGFALLSQSLDFVRAAQEGGLHEVWLEVHEKNKSAQNLYFCLGFKEMGRRPKYYRDGGVALLLTKAYQEPDLSG